MGGLVGTDAGIGVGTGGAGSVYPGSDDVGGEIEADLYTSARASAAEFPLCFPRMQSKSSWWGRKREEVRNNHYTPASLSCGGRLLANQLYRTSWPRYQSP